jgi:hypothetical protein
MQWKLPNNETLIKIAIAIAFAALLYYVFFRKEREPDWKRAFARDFEYESFGDYEEDYEDDYEDDSEDDYEVDAADNQVFVDKDAEDDTVSIHTDAEDDQVFVSHGEDNEAAYDEELDDMEHDNVSEDAYEFDGIMEPYATYTSNTY